MRFMLMIALLFSSLAHSANFPRVKKLNHHDVVFQSSEARFVKSLGMYKTRIAARWGVHVYEIADAYFKCAEVSCRFVEARTRAFFESCHENGNSFRCQKRLRASSHYPANDYHRPGYWQTHADDGESQRDGSDWEGSDFPERDENDWETGGIVLF